MSERWRTILGAVLLLAFCLILFLPGFTSLPVIDRDEARFAQASRQMLAGNDFIDIRFQDEIRYRKPVGIYWAQAASASVIGRDEIWPYRLPSLIGAVFAVLLTYTIGVRLFGVRTAMIGAGLLALSPILGFEARCAKTDAVLLALVCASMVFLWHIRTHIQSRRIPAFALWVALALGILVKGPIIAMIVGLTVFCLWALNRDRAWIARLHPRAGLLVLTVFVLPWFIAITIISGGDFWNETIGHDLLSKLAGEHESHGAPPGAYMLGTLVGLWPGALFLLLGLPWIWKNRTRDSVRFLLLWALPAWAVFEMTPTKLPHYVLPLYPALALLAAAALTEGLPGRSLRRMTAILAGVLGLALGVAIIAIPILVDGALMPAALLAGLAFWTLTVLIWYGLWTGKLLRGTICGGWITAALALILTFGQVLPYLDAPWLTEKLVAMLDGQRSLALIGYHEPSAVFRLGTATALIDPCDVTAFRAAHPDGVLVVDAARLETVRAAHPDLRITGQVDGFHYNKSRTDRLTLLVP